MTSLYAEKPSTWTETNANAPIYFATALRVWKVYESRLAIALVWPEEGSFSPDGQTWTFNAEHADFQPLILDPTTAAALHAVYSALQEDKNKAKFRDWISKSRGHFGRMVDLAWDACTH